LCDASFAVHCNPLKTETTVPHISPHDIRSFDIRVPPLQLQRVFAASVAEIRDLEKKQAASRHRLGDLFQSVLYRAFQGEL